MRPRRRGSSLPWLAFVLCAGCLQWPDVDERVDPRALAAREAAGRASGERTIDREAPVDPVVRRASGEADERHAVAPPSGPLTLEAALTLAWQYSPALAQASASVDVARGNLVVADSGFYPTVQGNYGYQAFSSDTGFTGTPVGGRFPVLPVRGFGPGTQDFHVTEAQLKYTIFQFGKQWTRHDQAAWKAEVARLEQERAHQTVAFEVTAAYFRALEARSAVETAEKAVERAEAYAKEAADTLRRGVITQEENLRAQAAVASVRQTRADAVSEEEVAIAGLNRAMGIDVNASTRVAERREAPEFNLTLPQVLQLAVASRREIQVVRRGIAIAQGDVGIARADFLPTVSIQAAFSNVTGTDVQNANVGAGGIFVTHDLFSGGKRRGQLLAAEAGVRSAAAQAQQVCDGIAYEVNVAFRGVEDARERIGAAGAVFEQARENARLVASRARAGDATPAETVEAEAAETRSEQTFNAAQYLYQRALARLEYAVGAPLPLGPGQLPEARGPGGRPESPPGPPGTPSPFNRRSTGGPLPGLSSPPDLGGAAPPRAVPLPSPTLPRAPDGSRPPSLARPPYESGSPVDNKP